MPLHYELSDLRLLLILMRTRSLSASGEAAHLTTSAVSLRLRKLEDGIGAQLFTRTGKGLVPTEAGTALAAGFRFEPIIEAPSFSLLVELVARGPLAAVVPASAVPPNAPVEVRELEDSWAARPLAFVLPKARPALPSAIDFVEFALRTQKR